MVFIPVTKTGLPLSLGKVKWPICGGRFWAAFKRKLSISILFTTIGMQFAFLALSIQMSDLKTCKNIIHNIQRGSVIWSMCSLSHRYMVLIQCSNRYNVLSDMIRKELSIKLPNRCIVNYENEKTVMHGL